MSAQPGFRQSQPRRKPSLTLRRRLNAPPAKVFAAWTDPRKDNALVGADAAPRRCSAEIDPRVGGRFRGRSAPRTASSMRSSGVYREVIPDEKLVFTWAWRTRRSASRW